MFLLFEEQDTLTTEHNTIYWVVNNISDRMEVCRFARLYREGLHLSKLQTDKDLRYRCYRLR